MSRFWLLCLVDEPVPQSYRAAPCAIPGSWYNLRMAPRWLLYGANGYTGSLIAREAKRRGLSPILAGRGASVQALAEELGLEAKVFPLAGEGASPSFVASRLAGVSAVLHCAGPFSATSRPMLDACIEAGVHYLDITGEIDVFESIHARDAELRRAGIAALPGAGFDVVPTDCLAAMLKRELPGATQLKMAFKSNGRLSPGTAKSVAEGLALGGRVRRNGKIVAVPIAAKSVGIPFLGPSHGHPRLENAILAPWGDVATAFHSTGIPDIEFYIASPGSGALPARLATQVAMKAAGRLLRSPRLQSLVQGWIGKSMQGPSARERRRGKCWIWGEATAPDGATLTRRLEVPEGYRFTVESAIACAERVAAGEVPPGAWTPSKAFGPDFVLNFPEVRLLGAPG